MNRSEFAGFLRKLAEAVESGDSAEGCVVYALSDRGPGEIDLDIRVRTGNLEGQGGYHIVDTMPKGALAVDEPPPTCSRCAALETRQQELLQTIVRLTNETPFPDEIRGWEAQRAAMVAEVGSLRAMVAELERSQRAESSR